MNNDLVRFKNKLDNGFDSCDKVIILPHKNIDLDAISSAIGIALMARKHRKETHIIVDEEVKSIEKGASLVMEEAKDDFSIIDKSKYLDLENKNDLFILTDVNKKSMICNIDDINKSNSFIIDHHHISDDTLDCRGKFIDTSSSSASEIVSKLLRLYKLKPSQEIANYLLAGIYLDTYNFRKNVYDDTFDIASYLTKCGANVNDVSKYFISDIESENRVKNLINKANFSNVSIATINGEDDKEYSIVEIAKAADSLLQYDVDATFVIANIGGNNVYVSARSKNKIDVGNIMSYLGGGGNNCSGATKIANESIESVNSRLLKILTPSCYNS